MAPELVFALLYILLLADWIVAWLLIGRWIRSRWRATHRAVVWAHHAFAAAPAALIVVAATLVARAYASAGAWPRPGGWSFPGGYEPSNAPPESFGLHFELVRVLMFAALASFLAFPALHGALRSTLDGRRNRWLAAWGIAWPLAACAVVYRGPFAVAEWLM